MATEKIITLKNADKTIEILPRTKVSAISDDNGVGLQTLLDNVSNNLETNYYTADEIDVKLESATPKSHASADTTYGIGTGSNYGHVKLSDSTSSSSAASAGIAASPKAVKDAYDLANTAKTTADGKAPTSHASRDVSYGTGDDSYYGHLRLYDAASSVLDVTKGHAATPKEVMTAYELADTANTTANSVKNSLGTQVTYSLSGTTLTITTK